MSKRHDRNEGFDSCCCCVLITIAILLTALID